MGDELMANMHVTSVYWRVCVVEHAFVVIFLYSFPRLRVLRLQVRLPFAQQIE